MKRYLLKNTLFSSALVNAAGRATRIICCGILFSALHGTATAAPLTVDEIFLLFDSDGNQVIDHAEFRLKKVMLFSLLDSNQNLTVEYDETALSSEAFATADTNHDGRLTGFEFVDSPLAEFELIDVNHDEVVTLEELTLFVQRIRN